jgi:hypothetical protein
MLQGLREWGKAKVISLALTVGIVGGPCIGHATSGKQYGKSS